MDKAEKIKAAKKKLKEFQSHKTTKDDKSHQQIENIQEEKSQIVDLSHPIQNDIPQQSIISSYFDSPNINQNISSFDFVQQTNNNNNIQEVIQTQTPVQLESFNNDDKTRELQNQIDQQNHQISQLKSEVEFHRTTALNLQKSSEELNRIKQQEKQHSDLVNVLVREKSNLQDSLQKSEYNIQQLKNENEELHNRLNVSRHRVKQLETQSHPPPPAVQQPEMDVKKIEEMINERVKQLNELNKNIDAERNDLKLLLDQQRIEMENLQRNFDHISTELHLATVKISQLSEGTQQYESPDVVHQSQINALSQEVAIKQQKIHELNAIIDQLNNDRDVSETQYQNYVSAITSENQELKNNTNELTRENDKLGKREQELLKHVSDLERNMQQQLQKQRIYAEQNSQQEQSNSISEDVDKLTSQINELRQTNEGFKTQLSLLESEKLQLSNALSEKTEEIQGLEFQLEKMRTITPNLTQLMTDFEDKSTAASRALSQNQSLKEQLDELQRAFVNISNDKMELTDKLQSEMHLCREIKNRYDSMESELTTIKEKWQWKENEMIRLSKENTELEKKILQQNIEIDRLRHYESKDYHGTERIVESELEHCKHLIESLTNKINILESTKTKDEHHDHDDHDHDHHHHHHHDHNENSHSHKHDHHHHSHEHKHCDDKHLLEEIEMLKMEKNELIKAINDFQMTKKSDSLKDQENLIENGDVTEEMSEKKMHEMSAQKSFTASIATEEALEKLQGRFRRTMLEVAELTEEKQRLEHVVTQLQFETETIGEYITLYQNQRRLLKQKEHERDIQLRNLANDREMMNNKLVQLNGLIENFVLQHTDQIEVAKEATKLLESEPLIMNSNNNHEMDLEKLKKETAGKILQILSDIKTTNTKTYDSVGVENCACCYGELKTV